jgi:type I restriction enzyme S subunit
MSIPSRPILSVLQNCRSGYWGGEAGTGEADVSVIRNGDVSATGEIKWAALPSRSFSAHEADRSAVVAGDLVLTTSGICGQVAFVASSPDRTTCVSNFLRLLRVDAAVVDPKYLFHYMRRPIFRSELRPFVRGSTLQNLSVNAALAAVEVPLPAVEEQRRIADILDRADALRAKRREALAQLDALTESIFLDMFGEGWTTETAWPVRAIGELCFVKGGKRLPKGSSYSAEPTPYRYIRATDLRLGQVDGNSVLYLSAETYRAIERYTVATGDIVISIAGTIGMVAPITEDFNGANLTENAAKLVPKSGPNYTPGYLSTALRTRSAQDQIKRNTGQVTIGKLALFRIEMVKVPLPPISLQREFDHRAERVRGQRRLLINAARDLASLSAALQQRAFAGEL